jgi:hypothetical protein
MDNSILELVTELQKNTTAKLREDLEKILGKQRVCINVKISVSQIPMDLMPENTQIQPVGMIYWLAHGRYTDNVQLQSKSGGCTVIINR